MKTNAIRYAAFGAFALTLVASARSVGADQPLLISGAKVLSAEGDRLLNNEAVLIVGNRIADIGAPRELKASSVPKTLDLSGLVLVPGLIDLHTHLLLHPYDEAAWNDQVLKESLELRTIRAVVAARATLEAGFTTIRDLGTEGAGYADVALRNAIHQDIIPGPRILAVTRAIVATGCYGPSGFDPRWDMPGGAQVADGITGVRRVVREQIAAGADWIKVYADYRRRPGDPSTPTFSYGELATIVDEAHSAGLRVSAHANTSEAIRRAVNAGVATIEHGTDASDAVLTLMRDHDVALCPTLAAGEAMARYAGWKPGEPDPPRIRAAKQMFARALASGVTIACGSDAGVFAHGHNAWEIELMVDYGMSPTDALRAATSVAASVMGKGAELGRVEPGYLADLIAVKGNPLEDPAVLRSPVMVIKDGKIALDRR